MAWVSFKLINFKLKMLNYFSTVATSSLQQRRPVATVRPFLLRRGTATNTGGSFKRRSLKLRRNTKDGKDIEADCKNF